MKSSVLVIGDQNTILGFKSLGLSTLIYEKKNSHILDLIQEYIQGGTKIIFFIEDIKSDLEKLINKYQKDVYPMFVVIPALGQESTEGKKNMRNLVVQALGSSFLE